MFVSLLKAGHSHLQEVLNGLNADDEICMHANLRKSNCSHTKNIDSPGKNKGLGGI